MRTLSILISAAVVTSSCSKKEEAPPEQPMHKAAPIPAKLAKVTFLLTGSENGHLLPSSSADAQQPSQGGAAEVMARWVTVEHHCDQPLKADGSSSCENDETLALSTGDNANGHAISSFFKGESTARAMKEMGYAASAFGNRELDWSREQFVKNAQLAGFPYLAANLKSLNEDGQALGIKPFTMVTRNGVKIAVVGLAAKKSTITPMLGRMTGLELIDMEDALSTAVTQARTDGANAIVVVADECLSEVRSVLQSHAEWDIAFVAGRQCDDGASAADVGQTKFFYAGRQWSSYAKALVTVDLAKAQADQLVSVETSMVEVKNDAQAPAPHAATKAIVDEAKAKVDEALGEQIGFSTSGIDQQSAEMTAWVTTALKEQFKADIGLVNGKGIRQSLPAGPITKATIFNVLPFDDQVVVVSIQGDALITELSNVNARYAGARARETKAGGTELVDHAGKPIDPKKKYSVAVTDYLFYGGDGFELNQHGSAPQRTNTTWQNAVIEWTKAKKSSEKKPLESMVPAPKKK